MIKAYRYLSGRIEPLAPEAIPGTLESAPDIVWIDVNEPTADEDRQVEKLLGISLPTREEMEEIEVSARLYQDDGAEFMTLTAIVRIDTEEPEPTPITFVLKENTVVTVRYAEPKAFANFLSRAQKPGAVQCSSGELVMLGLIEALCDRLADTLENVGRNIDGVSRAVFRRKPGEKTLSNTQDLQAIIEKIGRDGDLLTKVRESLVSINRVLTYHTTLDAKDKQKVKDARARSKVLYRDVVALTDQATFLSNKINFLLDATLGLINLQQNQIIKIFSVAAVVFLPPTLVASIYGMNFHHMPELDWELGYLWAIGLMISSAVLPYYYFKRRGWL
ncbi:MAG: magnesium/cobalt transporter CorA [Rhodomicrobium sp.]